LAITTTSSVALLPCFANHHGMLFRGTHNNKIPKAGFRVWEIRRKTPSIFSELEELSTFNLKGDRLICAVFQAFACPHRARITASRTSGIRRRPLGAGGLCRI
jgi:hypothetical protein